MTKSGTTWRVGFLAALVLFMFTGLGIRLAFLHLEPNAARESRVASMRHTEKVLIPERGRILDRNGNVLGMDLAVKDVWVSPKTILEGDQPVGFMAAHLARILQLEPAMIQDRMTRPGRQFEYIKRAVPQDEADRIARLQFKGVHFDNAMVRYYPQGESMCHLVGFSNLEGVGSAGIELALNTVLRGRPGLRISERDGRRMELYSRRQLDIPPRRGGDVTLTLDQHLQFMMEEALLRGMTNYNGVGAWAILMRVKTGEILAMASYPGFDLNEYGKSSEEERRNRAIAFNYEPGSTFKVLVIAAALNDRLVTPGQVIDCENGIWYFKGRPLRDYRPHGLLSVADVLQKSSNIGTAKIAVKMEEARLEKYLRDFGIGKQTGIDLPGEEGGILWPHSRWSGISVSRIAMGHEVAVTSLQLLNAVNAIANDGALLKPYVVQQTRDVDGQILYEGGPEILARPIRPETARLMAKLMTRVTEVGGTAKAAHMPGYPVAGKTGTAQKPIPGGYSDRLNIASFVGFLPANDPEISMIVVVDEPWPLRTGGAVAAPIFRDIAKDVVRYLNIPETNPDPVQSARSH